MHNGIVVRRLADGKIVMYGATEVSPAIQGVL